jgi:Phage terminase large subunit (GpA)
MNYIARWQLALERLLATSRELAPIPPDMTFRQWCESLAAPRPDPGTREMRPGLLIDGKPFRLDDRPAMAWLYDQVPSTPEQCFRHRLVMMKCAQVGFTVMEMLAAIYLGLKFGPATVGMFLPDMNLAGVKSSERFMPIVRSIPEIHALMTQDAQDGSGRKRGEGNVTRRRIGEALFVFSWTSGKATTESIPMDFLSFDEVQEMTLPQMEKTMERLSASKRRFTLMGSTANWPELDIHHWFKLGTQHRFHTACPTCGVRKPLDDYFPDCIKWDKDAPHELTGRPGRYRYVCPNGHWIDDSQCGEWVADNPDAWDVSVHFHQMLSPDISPGEIMRKYVTSTDKKNFFNRVLGKPYLDPTQIPVTREHMKRCVEAGRAAGVVWKTRAKHTYMGIDQMGNFNLVIIKERLPDGRQAVVHLEEIYSDDPFARCDELMRDYGVDVCVVEINPNYNEAKSFANRHRGRVFICDSYGEIKDDMLQWGDAPSEGISERRTDEGEQDRFTVRIDQFKCMQRSFAKFTGAAPQCLWPDDQALVQEIKDKGVVRREAVAPRAFHHFTKTALVVESVKEGGEKEATTNKVRRRVRKVGIDPHASYANMLCDVAWARAHGTTTFMLPPENLRADDQREKAAIELEAPGLPAQVVGLMERLPSGRVCARCEFYPWGADGPAEHDVCKLHTFNTRAKNPGCQDFEIIEALADADEAD